MGGFLKAFRTESIFLKINWFTYVHNKKKQYLYTKILPEKILSFHQMYSLNALIPPEQIHSPLPLA